MTSSPPPPPPPPPLPFPFSSLLRVIPQLISLQIVYFEEGALSNHIIIDPAWLCKDVLGQALAPGNFPKASLTRVGSHRIRKETVQRQLSQCLERNHISIIIQLLQNFDLCHHDKENDELCFPAFLTEGLDPNLWKPDAAFEGYTGRRLVCSDITDTFPPGFFSRLQVQILNSLRSEKVYLFKGSVLVDGNGYQCLVEILTPTTATPSSLKQHRVTYSSAITLKGRAVKGQVFSCSQLLDLVQTMIAQLVRVACPTIFLDLEVLSSSDLKAHAPEPSCYTIYEVISAESRNQEVVNSVTGVRDSPLDLLYFGDKVLQKTSSGRNMKVAYLSEDIVQRIEELLVDGDKVISCENGCCRSSGTCTVHVLPFYTTISSFCFSSSSSPSPSSLLLPPPSSLLLLLPLLLLLRTGETWPGS